MAGLAIIAAATACSDIPTTAPRALDSALPPAASRATRPDVPVFKQMTPTYPAVAVYIVYREYVNQNPGLTHISPDDRRYQHYMEKRLRELYPDRGYSGMMRDAVAEARYNRKLWREYEEGNRLLEMSPTGPGGDCDVQIIGGEPCTGGGGVGEEPSPPATYEDDASWSGQEEFFVDETRIPTLQEEADSLQLTSREFTGLNQYEELALNQGDYRILSTQDGLTRDDRIRMAAAGMDPNGSAIRMWGPVIAIPLGVAAFFGPRIIFAKWRAQDASASYYPTLVGSDDRRDAFRHIYVNVLLRRYCTGTVAKMVMDANEWGEEDWGARVMDYHNNDLGRAHRYKHFRGHWFWDRWSWGVWGHRVRRYVDDASTNGRFVTQLAQPGLTETQARSIQSQVAANHYIYFE